MSGPDLLRYCGMDAAKWASEFRKTALQLGYSDMDEGWLIGWFANAIMNAHDIVLNVGPMNGDHAEWLQTQKAAEQTSDGNRPHLEIGAVPKSET